MPERKPTWLEEALDSVADIDIADVNLGAIEWPELDPDKIEWGTFDFWEGDNGEA